MEVEAILERVRGIVHGHLPGAKLILFGSWAKGDALPEADLDVGVLTDEKMPFALYTQIRQEIDAIPTLRKIDFVDLNSVDDNFREAALKHAKTL